MKIGVIGGWGHHSLLGMLGEQPAGDRWTVAVASDGHDAEAARRRHAAEVDRLSGRGEVSWFDDPLDMLDTFQPDLVSVGSVYAHNSEGALACLERGTPCSSDKPIAADWSALERIEALARSPGAAPLTTEFTARCDPAMMAARDVVAAGEVGKVVLAHAQKSYRFGQRPAWYGRRADYAGTIPWVSSHGIDFVRFVTGLGFDAAMGAGANVARPEFPDLEDAAINLFEMTGGGLAVVHADYHRPDRAATHGDDRIRVVGDRGVVEVIGGVCRVTTHDQAEHVRLPLADPLPVHRALFEALTAGRSDLYGSELSLELARVILTARDAADQRARVAVPRQGASPGLE